MAEEITGSVEYSFDLGKKGNGDGEFNLWVQHFTASRDGSVMYACDAVNKRIHVFDLKTRKFKFTIPVTIGRHSYQPRGVHVLRNGDLCVCCVGIDHESCIATFSPEGNFLSSFGQGQIGYPMAMTVDPSDIVVVYNRRNTLVSRWTIDGCQLNEFELDDVNGDILRMAADSLGRIIVPDHLDNKVHIFNPNGARAMIISPHPKSPHAFKYPAGVCCDRHDNVYVCDLGHHRVVKFSKQGEYRGAVLSEFSDEGVFDCHDAKVVFGGKILYTHLSATYVKVFCF